MRLSLFVTCSLLLLNSLLVAEAHACEAYGNQTIEVPVAWRFTNPDLNKQWIAETLHPRLVAENFDTFGMTQAQSGDSFVATFCLMANDSKAKLNKLTFSLGDEQLSLKARPIHWTSKPNEYDPKATTRYGRMTVIAVPARPDIKKLIFNSAKLISNDKGEPRLKIECFNPTAVAHPGVSLKFAVTDRIACAAPDFRYNPQMIIPMHVRFGRNGVDIFGGDPAFPGELFKRTLDFKEPSCSGRLGWFTLELGQSGTLDPGLNVLRYAFAMDGKPVDKNGKAIAAAIGLGGFSFVRTFEEMASEITIEGSNDVYPLSIRVQRE